jgi:hypothetical protein
MTTRTDDETKLLREEAQRLARENWKRTDIAQTLGVPLHTLARWAYEDGWRQKDLAAEGAAERIAAIREQIGQRAHRARSHDVRSMCGRSAEQLEYKSADYSDEAPKPAAEPTPDLRYPSNDPDYGPWAPSEDLPKFLTRGGPKDERVCWAAPQLWARTPPWAPGNETEEPELASLWLAEDLMRQGLLVEAERAMRFTKNWLKISKAVFDKQDEDDARRRAYHERQEQERQREKARCKALGLPDPDEVWKAQCEAGLAQFAAWERRQGANNNITTTEHQPENPDRVEVKAGSREIANRE